MKKNKAQHGGARPNSGRKSILTGPSKLLVTLEQKQRSKLEHYVEKEHIPGMSAGVRHLIDDLPEESDNGKDVRDSGTRPASGNGPTGMGST